MGDLHIEALVLGNQAAVLQELGESADSLALARRSLRCKQQLDLTGSIATSLNNIAGNLFSLGKAEVAAQLHGAAQAVRQKAGITLGPAFHRQLEAEQDNVHRSLGAEVFNKAFARGGALTQEAAITLALAD